MDPRDGGIVSTPDVLGGEPRLEGRRIAVRQIVESVIDSGYEPAEVADQLDISLAEVHLALTYHHRHPDEMAAVRDRHREQLAAIRERAIDPPETLTR